MNGLTIFSLITATQWIPPDGYVPKAEREAQEAETHDESDAESAPSPSESEDEEEEEEEDVHGIKRKHVSNIFKTSSIGRTFYDLYLLWHARSITCMCFTFNFAYFMISKTLNSQLVVLQSGAPLDRFGPWCVKS